ncbi:hypothetical protein ABW19_dt0201336 [Dactylella cylindrospora]|nr:hypothetical protein ABW19_dt0201336 [Dactylella cylindrospora]
MSDSGNQFDLPADAADYVDIPTFEQILEMDDEDGAREFSSSLVFGFFEQAATTFEDMDSRLAQDDLPTLSSLGHFLKGSSATLGIYKVRDSCEKIQHLGARTDETGNKPISEAEALEKIKEILPKMRKDYDDAEKWLKNFFGSEED